MGILDLFGGSREKREAKRIRDLTKRSQEKYGDPSVRARALEGLRDLGTPEAIAALLQRFTARTEPGITDTEEKEYTLEILNGFGERAVEPVIDFLERSESGISWGVRCLQGLVDEPTLVDSICRILDRLSTQYARDPDKKVTLLKLLSDYEDEKIAKTAALFLDDPSDDVRMASLSTLVGHKAVDQAPQIAECLLTAEAPRIRSACAQALVDLGAPITEKQEELRAALPEGFRLDDSGKLHKA